MLFSSKGGPTWIVAFLGNPGLKYAGTRHNAGFMTADALARKKGISINRVRFQALTAACELGGQRALLMKPQTYMNLSGDAVQPAAAFYKVPAEHVLVVSDDVSLPTGKLRIRASGSAGGHNGLKSIIARLGTDAFPRVKIGVGAPPNEDYDLADWVLSGFHGQDADLIAAATERAADALEAILSEGVERAMNRFNG
jgi:PTH1 family peptidyl-tRNA hydrolase